MNSISSHCMIPVLATAFLATASTAVANNYSAPDATDQDTLERALYLCQWKISHEVPESAPTPEVCRSGAVSMDDAMLQHKQWWTYWTRLDGTQALKASQQFSTDFAGFHARLQVKPEIAAQLLPPGIALTKGDWRVRFVHDLVRRYGKAVAPIR